MSTGSLDLHLDVHVAFFSYSGHCYVDALVLSYTEATFVDDVFNGIVGAEVLCEDLADLNCSTYAADL